MPQTKHSARGKPADNQSHRQVSAVVEALLLKELQAPRETLRYQKTVWSAAAVAWVADEIAVT